MADKGANPFDIRSEVQASNEPDTTPSSPSQRALIPAPVEAVRTGVIYPGEEGNAINVEEATQFTDVLTAVGPIGNPTVRRSKRLRSLSPERFEEASGSQLPKKKKTQKPGGVKLLADLDWTDDSSGDSDYAPSDSGNETVKSVTPSDTAPQAQGNRNTPEDSSSDDPELMQTLATFLAGLRQSAATPSELPPCEDPVTTGVDVSLAPEPIVAENKSTESTVSGTSSSDSPVSQHNIATEAPVPEPALPASQSSDSTFRPSDDTDPSSPDVGSLDEEPEDDPFEISQAFSPKFYTEACSNQFNRLASRSMISERKINTVAFDKFHLTELLRRRNLLSTVSISAPFCQDVIIEFYANLLKDVKDSESRKYGHVYLRNHIYEFTPEVINEIYGTDAVENDGIENDYDAVVNVLTGGLVSNWPPNPTRLLSSQLTSLYAVLHKVAIANWVPSRNNTVVTKEQGVVLYKVGQGIPFDFGRLAFSVVTRYAETQSTLVGLPYPSLIFTVLQSQGFLRDEGEKLTTAPEPLNISHNLLKGDRVKDLPLQFPDVPAPAPSIVPPPAATPTLLTSAEIQKQISLIDRQIANLQQARMTYLAMLNALSGQKGGDEDDPSAGAGDEAAAPSTSTDPAPAAH